VADTFALDVSRFVAKAEANAKAVAQKVTIDVLRSVIDKSPVGNPALWKSPAPAGYVGGRFRANWNTSVGRADTATTTKTDAAGSGTKSRGAVVVQGWDGQGDCYITNSLPYGPELEYKGHSSQAPAGMVRVTVVEFQSFVNQAVRSLPK